MPSGSLVQRKGRGAALVSATKRLMAAWRAANYLAMVTIGMILIWLSRPSVARSVRDA